MKPINKTLSIGIVGCGHLGMALAKTLIANGFTRENLRVSFGGNPATLLSIRQASLERTVSTNADIFIQSDVVFITLRPDGVNVLQGLEINTHCMIVSCVAGVHCLSLKELLGREVLRLMPSSPQSIELKRGIAALYPANTVIQDLLFDLDLETVVLDKERQLHFFTSLVCLPAAYLQMQIAGLARKKPDLSFFTSYRFDKAARIIKWAKKNTPAKLKPGEIIAYISRMATKGGITEAIVESIRHGDDINRALSLGIQRSEQIAAEYVD